MLNGTNVLYILVFSSAGAALTMSRAGAQEGGSVPATTQDALVTPKEPNCKKTISKQVMSGGQVKTVVVDNAACLNEWEDYLRALEALDFESPTLGKMKWIPAGTFTLGSAAEDTHIATAKLHMKRRVGTCVSAAVDRNPSLNGRGSLNWSIEGGKVTAAAIVDNTTGDSALGECILRSARAVRSDASLTAEISEAPWVVSKDRGFEWRPGGTIKIHSYDSTPHLVSLSRGFWMMEHEVTQGEWLAVMGSNPSRYSSCGPACPVEMVSWEDAVAFAERASARDGVPYRLPTEAEWEFAARGGQSHEYAGDSDAAAVGWTSFNSGGTTHPACTKARNGYGLCDMSGNVSEWVSDWYEPYRSESVADPVGAPNGSSRVRRGGGSEEREVRLDRRDKETPSTRSSSLGFRLVRTAP